MNYIECRNMLQKAEGPETPLGQMWTCEDQETAERLCSTLQNVQKRLFESSGDEGIRRLAIRAVGNEVHVITQNALDTLDNGIPAPLRSRALTMEDLKR